MLDDRDYMRRRPEPENKVKTGMSCVYALIAINVIMFIMTGSPQSEDMLMLNVNGVRSGMLWQPLTAMFMHADFSHILFNMWGLYIFGGIVAPRLGGSAFLALYLSTGLFGNLLWLTSELAFPPPPLPNGLEQMVHPLCGASGAVMGVTAAAAVMAPDIPMLMLFIPFPIKLRTMAIVFFALDIILQLSGKDPFVAHLAHIGGFISGYLFLKVFFRREILWDPLGVLFGRRGYRPPPGKNAGNTSGWTYRRRPEREDDLGPNFSAGSNFGFNGTRVSQRELDYLLDKISRTGINSLTEQELQRLKQAREEMRRS